MAEIKCNDCIHKGVCAFQDDHKKFDEEVKKLCAMKDYQHFKINYTCNYFLDASDHVKRFNDCERSYFISAT